MSHNANSVNADAWAFNLGGDAEMGERFDFKPQGGGWRKCYGVIFRDPPAQVGVDGLVTKPRAIIEVSNRSRGGIASSEVVTGARIRFCEDIGVAGSQREEGIPVSLAKDGNNQAADVVRLEV